MRNIFFKLTGVVVIILSLGGGWLGMELQHFVKTPLNVEDSSTNIIVPPGTNVKQLSQNLSQQGVIEQPIFFEWLARWRGSARKLQAGEYRLQADMTPDEFLQMLVSGRVVQHSLTLVEGWSFKQMMQAVNDHEALTRTLTELSGEAIMAQMGFSGVHPEGRFSPETYHFPSGTTDVEFLQRAYEEMQTYLEQAWPERAPDLPLKTPDEALILASIVEKETAVAEERDRIAGVFIRRLKKGMRLQTDPTVIYGMGESFDGNIRRKDLLKDTPYNTYTRKGLPPTPIAMPSKAAINAALHPDERDYLYFVARGDGSHYFSATLEEHNKAVREYQILRPRRERKTARQ